MATPKPPVTLRIFREHYDRLVDTIQDPLPLAARLLSLRIITPAVKEDISAVGLSTLKKNNVLLSAVEKQIQLHPQTFHVFLSALKEDPSMQLLVDSMQGTHVKAASTESRQSVEEQSTPGVKRICICNEYNASPTLSLEQESVQGLAPPSGMLQPIGYHIPLPQHQCSGGGGYQPASTPSQLQQGGVGERVDPTGDLEENKSGSAEEKESSSTEGSEEYETEYEALSEEEKLRNLLQNSIANNDVDCFHSHLDKLDRLLQNNELMKKLLEKSLCYAAYVGSDPIVETLIQNGVDINAMSRVPEHPRYSHVVMSPLHWAAVEGHTNTVKCLVEEGANLNCLDDAAYTPLHWAARNGHVDTVQYLVEKGANIHIEECLERIPQDLAAECKYEEVVAYLKRAADPNMLGESESTGREHELRQSPENTAVKTRDKDD